MGEIYSMAQRVVIWLGISGPHSHAALASIDRLGHSIEVDFKRNTYQARLDAPDVKDELEKCFDCCYSAEAKQGIEHLLTRSWFRRLWIWQEVAQAREAIVVCGFHKIDWTVLSKAIACLYVQVLEVQMKHPDRKDKFGPLLEKMRQVHMLVRGTANTSSTNLFTLLECTQHSECEDPRDRIYSQLSMLPENVRSIIEPDYTKSVRQVYMDTMLHISTRNKSLMLLGHCGKRAAKYDLNLPSWVPDWSGPRDVSQFRLHNACGRSKPEMEPNGDSLLCINGIHCATISDISPPVPHAATYVEVLSTWRKWASPESHGQSYMGGIVCLTLIVQLWSVTNCGSDFLSTIMPQASPMPCSC
jgi:hypothetical protein